MDAVAQKLTAARTRLILDKPFLGALVLRLPLIEADPAWCQTSATDARSLYYSRDYMTPLTLGQVQFVLAHEALHCALSHFARRSNRDGERWNVACDHAVNLMLLEDGLEPVPGALYDKKYEGMTVEEIYPCIDSDDNEEPMDQHLYDDSPDARSARELDRESSEQTEVLLPVSNDGDNEYGQAEKPPALNESERDQLDTQWRQRLASAAQQAMHAGKLNPSVARMIERILQSTVPWRTMLARFMSGSARVDYNLMRPSQRREGDAILPSLHTRQVDIVVALDTSGSIDQTELDAFVAEVDAIKGLVNARITLLACDAALDQNGPWVFESWQSLQLPATLHGGGSTDFSPVFDWVAENSARPDLLVYFTDAKGRFPASTPAVNTLWLVKGNAAVPWGQRIQLN